MKDTTVCVAFYSPSGYELPKQHLASTLSWLAASGARISVAQVVKPGCTPQPTPPSVECIVYESSQACFWKENLWNILARRCETKNLFFCDSDVQFSRNYVVALAERELAKCDVVQPFEAAHWVDRCGAVYLSRESAAKALVNGREPSPGICHPGFSWAMTRDAFDKLGGFYQGHPFGGGDVAFSYSLDDRWVVNRRTHYLPDDTICWHGRSFIEYQRRGVLLGLKVGYLRGVNVYHQWHGDVAERQYATRCNYLRIERGSEYPLSDRGDGLLEWDTPGAASAAQAYFDSRMEDGTAADC